MFRFLGTTVLRFWPAILIGWLLILIGSSLIAPSWESISHDGDIAFLPADSPSSRGDHLYQQAFPNQYAGSSIVLVLERPSGELSDEDYTFIEQVLTPELAKLAKDAKGPGRLIQRTRTFAEKGAGTLLISPNNQATLVIVDLSAAFLDPLSAPLIQKVEKRTQDLVQNGKVPKGLEIRMTGSATAGRDLAVAEMHSVRAIEKWTIIVVITLLLLLYRAPLIALIPLLTVFVAVQISLNLLALLGQAGILELSSDVRIFITVLSYGAGVDYCLFLIARYREETSTGKDPKEALAHSIARVGHSISASAATVICGIGVLAFMQFGKIREAGMVIPLALFIVLCGTLTFTPSLLCLAGKWAFWPLRPPPQGEPKALASSIMHRIIGWNFWEKVGPALLRRPGIFVLATVTLMAPFAMIALLHYQDESYNPIEDLPAGAPSVAGTQAMEKNFPVGLLGTFTVFVENKKVNFSEIKGISLIGQLTDRLRKNKEALGLADIRSVAKPLGITAAAQSGEDGADSFLGRSVLRSLGARYYVSRAKDYNGHLTKVDLIFNKNPYSVEAVDTMSRIQAALATYLPEELKDAQLYYSGATLAIRDLSEVKGSDQEKVEIWVPLVIFLLLFLVLRKVTISLYLVLSVLFSYLTTLGVTFVVFWHFYPQEFKGLDWKVPIFLFTILVAVGEDYNIFLITRIKEEQIPYGPLQGILHALNRTGRVISSCGIIMAGTFASLFSGSLLTMKELGFALSFGILLDTLVVRPILVPAFLILLESRLGPWGKYLALSRNASPNKMSNP